MFRFCISGISAEYPRICVSVLDCVLYTIPPVELWNAPTSAHAVHSFGDDQRRAGFEPGDAGTILQVVRNPASLAPYIACSLVALGLVTQFLMHLFSFARKRAQQTKPQPARSKPVAPLLEPALANGKGRRL